jgi:putative glycosyltransferase (TIGR04372 family)
MFLIRILRVRFKMGPIINIAKFFLKSLLIFPIFLLIKFIKPWKTIRFGVLPSHSYGAFLITPELYLCYRKKYEKKEKKYLDIFYYNDVIVNRYLAEKWKDHLIIFNLAKYIDLYNRMYLKSLAHQINILDFFADPDGLLKQYPPFFNFTDEEKKLGERLLKDLGVPLDKPIVCMFNRDKKFFLTTFQNKSNSEQIEENRDFRNASIKDYLPAAEFLITKGYFVVRMGCINEEKIQTVNSNILDYVFSGKRNEFLDLYIFSICKFAFGCFTGISFCATLFRKSVGYGSVFPFFTKYINPDYYDLFLPNKYYLIDKNNIATIDEIINFNKDNNDSVLLYKNPKEVNVHCIKNSPEDIKEMVREMHARENSNTLKFQNRLNELFIKKVDAVIPQGKMRESMIPSFYLKKLENEIF